MSARMELGSDRKHLIIEVLGYENSTAQDRDDANWLRCHLEVEIGPFTARMRASMMTHDFVSFHRELRDVCLRLEGTAVFATYENALHLNVQMQRRGNASISGSVQVVGEPRATLTFDFELDQTFLCQTVQDLDALLRQFPTVD